MSLYIMPDELLCIIIGRLNVYDTISFLSSCSYLYDKTHSRSFMMNLVTMCKLKKLSPMMRDLVSKEIYVIYNIQKRYIDESEDVRQIIPLLKLWRNAGFEEFVRRVILETTYKNIENKERFILEALYKIQDLELLDELILEYKPNVRFNGFEIKRYIRTNNFERFRRLREYIGSCVAEYPTIILKREFFENMSPEILDEMVLIRWGLETREKRILRDCIIGNNLRLLKHIHRKYSITFQEYCRGGTLKYASYECFVFIAENNVLDENTYRYLLKTTRDHGIMRYILEKCEYLILLLNNRSYKKIYAVDELVDIKRNHQQCFEVLIEYGLNENLGSIADLLEAVLRNDLDYILSENFILCKEQYNNSFILTPRSIRVLMEAAIKCDGIEIFISLIDKLVARNISYNRIYDFMIRYLIGYREGGEGFEELKWLIENRESNINIGERTMDKLERKCPEVYEYLVNL